MGKISWSWTLPVCLPCSTQQHWIKTKSVGRKTSSHSLFSKQSFIFLATTTLCSSFTLQCVIFPFSVKSIPRHTQPGQGCICHIYHTSCSTVASWTMLVLCVYTPLRLALRQGKITHPALVRLVIPKWQCFLKIWQTISLFFQTGKMQKLSWNTQSEANHTVSVAFYCPTLLNDLANWRELFPSPPSSCLPFPTFNSSVILLTWSYGRKIKRE